MKNPNINQQAVQSEQSWGGSYNILWPLINKKKLRVGAEIGVAFGGHSQRILDKTNAKLYSIDPFRHINGYDDAMNFSNEKFNKLYKFVEKRLSVYGKKSVLIRKKSMPAAKIIKEPLDFIYIDGDHSYEGIKQDILTWFPKINEGGIISGHDYGHINFSGIKEIVDKFFSRFNWSIHTHKSGVWWVEKKPLNISYIIPAYNCQETIKDAVKSIYKKNFKDGDELIIVDDASVDSTPEILKKLSHEYTNLKIITHKYNKGGGGARNTAVENAKNELIFCLDHDNILAENSVSKLKIHLILTISDSCSFQVLKYFKKNIKNLTHTWEFSHLNYTFKNYLSTEIVPGASGNLIFTKNSWIKAGRYPEDSFLDTWGLGLRQVMSGSVISVLPDSYYYHRIGLNSCWIRETKITNPSIEALKHILPHYDLLSRKDRRYLMSKNREKWLLKLSKRPIIIKSLEKSSKNLAVIKKIQNLIKVFK
ncbi:MAG: glycosyltransferase [Candidatus Pacebacteria bacterium]|jgi:glycosyltransferase involved in cell wall biosynthesis|nr:glycosyltransferase [Candidatus Paceibacterota bacterium]